MPEHNVTAETPALSVAEREQRRKEWRMFLFIIVFLFPLLTFALVGAMGFSIWMYQLVMGPPGAS